MVRRKWILQNQIVGRNLRTDGLCVKVICWDCTSVNFNLQKVNSWQNMKFRFPFLPTNSCSAHTLTCIQMNIKEYIQHIHKIYYNIILEKLIYSPNIEWLVLCCGQLCINRLGYQGLNPIHSRNTDQGYLGNYIFCSNRKRSRIFVYGKWYILEQQKEITFKLNFKISLWWFTILFTFRVAGWGLNCYCLNCNWLQNKQKLQKSFVHAPISSHSIYLQSPP